METNGSVVELPLSDTKKLPYELPADQVPLWVTPSADMANESTVMSPLMSMSDPTKTGNRA